MSEFSDFIRSATDDEKKDVYSDVIDRAAERQNMSNPMSEVKPVAWRIQSDQTCQIRYETVESEAECVAKEIVGVLHPLYDEAALAQARAEAIEECAKVCEGVAEHAADSRSCYAADNCADAIRALDERTEKI